MPEPISMHEKYFKDPKREPVLVDYVRTPVGKRRGTVGLHRGDDLVVHCYETILNRIKILSFHVTVKLVIVPSISGELPH